MPLMNKKTNEGMDRWMGGTFPPPPIDRPKLNIVIISLLKTGITFIK